MKYKTAIINILSELGLQDTYKGCEYIFSSIDFISENEDCFAPVTKILYMEIAKMHNTSSLCVEKNIRDTITKIWSTQKNDALTMEIFGERYVTKSPSNMPFLTSLYQYLKQNAKKNQLINSTEFKFKCPKSGDDCEFCSEFVFDKIEEFIANGTIRLIDGEIVLMAEIVDKKENDN